MSWSEIMMGLALGIGLSAACGFRVFVPLLIVSLVAHAGWLPLAHSFAWLGSWTALTVFTVATVFEVGAYYVPWLDHILDVLTTPAAVIAGTVLTASQLTELDPLVKWTMALVAGGGTAGLVQGLTTAARAVSTTATGGLANPLFSTFEWAVRSSSRSLPCFSRSSLSPWLWASPLSTWPTLLNRNGLPYRRFPKWTPPTLTPPRGVPNQGG